MTRREALRITAVSGMSLALGGSLAWELVRRAGLHRVSETRDRLGTLVSLTAVHPERDGARAVVAAGFAEMERLEGILSRHARGTPVWRLNQEGRLEAPPPELLHVLREARRHHALTGGAFDPTVAPLLALWEGRRGSGEGPPPPAPTAAAIQEARERVGFEGVTVTDDAIAFARAGMALTLDGIAKGHVVDRTVAALTAAGAERVLVDAGGDMGSGGAGVVDDPWRVGVQDPHRRGSLGEVRLAGHAVATSGDYMQAYTQDRRHHHIVDPRTGRSPDHTSSVTVVTPTALEADALSTALLVLGPEEGMALLDRLPEAEGMMVAKDGTRSASRAFAAGTPTAD